MIDRLVQWALTAWWRDHLAVLAAIDINAILVPAGAVLTFVLAVAGLRSKFLVGASEAAEKAVTVQIGRAERAEKSEQAERERADRAEEALDTWRRRALACEARQTGDRG